MKSTIYPNGDISQNQYDKRNRISKAQLTSGNVSYLYHPDDTLKQIDYSTGAKTQYKYTPRNQSEQIRHTLDGALLAELNYSYDKNDNRKTESKNFGQESLITEYDFDELNRITDIRYPAQYGEAAKTVNYTFDNAHNRNTETISQDSETTSKVYNYNNLDQLTAIQTTGDVNATQTAYTYDNNGSVSQKVVTQNIGGASPDSSPTGTQTITTDYQFDIRQQLKAVNTQEQLNTSPSPTPTLAANYYYDASGQRLRTQYKNPTTNEITQAQHSIYQGIKLLSQYDVDSSNALNINANYQFNGGMNIGRRAFAEEDSANNTQTFYHSDALGSVLATTKFDHSIAARYDYDAWGKELNNTGTSDNPIGFTGHQMDRESENKTGLIYANARYLDPDTGRFLSFDPFAGYDDKPISLHRYLYAYQNPVKYTDPDGNIPLLVIAGYLAYNAVMSAIDTAGDAAIDVGVSEITGQNSEFDASGSFVENMVLNTLSAGIGGKVNKGRKVLNAVDDVRAAKKSKKKVEGAGDAKSEPKLKTTKESPNSTNSDVEPAGNKVTGPKGGKATSTGKPNENGETIYKRDSGGHYSNDASTGNQKKEKSPNEHGNSSNSEGPHDVYAVRDAETGEVKRFGETGRGIAKREKEWQKYYRETEGSEVELQKIKTVEGKSSARELETKIFKRYETFNKKMPPDQKTYH